MYQEAQITATAAAELARRQQWPAGLLDAVIVALENADPTGLDALAGQGERWSGVFDALSTVAAARPNDGALIAPLLEIAAQGSGIADSVTTRATDAIVDVGQGMAADLRDVGTTSARALPWVLGAAAVGVAWYYLRGPGRGRA